MGSASLADVTDHFGQGTASSSYIDELADVWIHVR